MNNKQVSFLIQISQDLAFTPIAPILNEILNVVNVCGDAADNTNLDNIDEVQFNDQV